MDFAAAKSEYCMESEAITNWGQWGRWEECNEGEFVYGFSVKVEADKGDGDDTMANGITFVCRNDATGTTKDIMSTVAQWGSWTSRAFCPKIGHTQHYVTAVRLLVQPPTPHDDDMATLAAEIRCDDGHIKKG